MLNNTRKTRFKITVAIIGFNMIMAAWSLYIKETEITIIALGVISASGIMYKHSETKRPSMKKIIDDLNNPDNF